MIHEFYEISLRTASKLWAPQDWQEAIRPTRTDKCQRPSGDLAPGICTPLPKRICIYNTRTLNAGTNWQRKHLKIFSGQLASLLWFIQVIGQMRGKVAWFCLLQEVTNTALIVNRNPTRCNSMQIFIHSKVTLHVSGVTAPIIRCTKNCNRNLRYSS